MRGVLGKPLVGRDTSDLGVEGEVARSMRWVFLLLGGALVACGGEFVRFPLAEPLWVDDDRNPFEPRPPEWYSPYVWDGVDNSVLRPLSNFWRFERRRESVNVNALDEVPDSSWYTNRLSRHPMSPAEVALGGCEDLAPGTSDLDDDVWGMWTIVRSKPDGSSPGFLVRDEEGAMYLMKPDGDLQPERSSASDAIGAAVFWAAGYYAPCNRAVYVRPDTLVLAPDAEDRRTDGTRRTLTQTDIDAVIAQAVRLADGRVRFGLSRFIEGEPIAPWAYEGTWPADPNDVVPHENRREIRGMYVLSSWLSHIDSRQENTLASWMEVGEGHGYVRHYMIDFSDTLGVLTRHEALTRRFGHSGYFDLEHIVEDFFSLGLLSRPWHRARFGPAGRTLGYYDVERYVPDQWRPGYPNPAYERMTERDAAWMTRIVARFGDAHLEALVGRGRFSNPVVREQLLYILRARRDRILERWLTRLSPLANARAVGRRLCVDDLALQSGLRSASGRRYRARAFAGTAAARANALTVRPLSLQAFAGGRVCVEPRGAPRGDDEHGEYVVVDVVASSDGRETTGALRLHAYDLGTELRLVGLERLDGADPPPP